MIKLYNTMTRRKEVFVPLREGEVRMYTCGPTVYDYAHIGNFRAYVFEDLLRRFLEYLGYRVVQVMNITDVDDKTIARSREAEVSLQEYTRRYERAFFEDLERLNIERAEYYPRATEHIPEMVALIQRLMEKDYAYRGEDGSIYFDISKFKEYGKLSKLKLEGLKAGARVRQDEYAKEEAQDFALWKAWSEEDGDVYWDTPLGRGRPGWHIECSAMSMRYLGETLDIHAGGVDLIFPHHENEIAQSEAATGKTFVRYWVHNEHLLVEGRKMSKRYGNFYTLRDLLARGYDALAIRYLLLATHYRRKLNFTFKALEDASRVVRRLSDFMQRLEEYPLGKEEATELSRRVEVAKREFDAALRDDLDTPRALAAVFRLLREANRAMSEGKAGGADIAALKRFFADFNRVFGIIREHGEELPEELLRMIREREEARKRKDYATADRLREELLKHGVVVEDTPRGTRWKWKK
ncbi:cysteine--tRNA ligase [Candidatus Pyrohabitans sp.]